MRHRLACYSDTSCINFRSHKCESESETQTCRKCQPQKMLTSFSELLSHNRSIHRKFGPAAETLEGKSQITNYNRGNKLKMDKFHPKQTTLNPLCMSSIASITLCKKYMLTLESRVHTGSVGRCSYKPTLKRIAGLR